MSDPFVGTWKLNPVRSEFDANHRPREAKMHWSTVQDGTYLMLAEGVDGKGQLCHEKPQTLHADGRPYPVEGLPGLRCITTRPDPHTIQAQVTREDGSLAGEGRYVIAADGNSMTAVTAGFDSQLRRFESRTVWDRVS